MEEGLRIKIGADFGDVEKRFADLFKTFDQFGKAGAAGVNAVTNAFSGLTKAAAVNVSTSLNRVINSLQTLGETGTGLGKVTDGLAKLRTAAAGAGLPGLAKAAEDLRVISARFEELQRTAGKLTPAELNVFATAISDLKREAAVFSPINITPSAESLRGINEIQAEIAEVKAEALAGVPPIVFKFDSEGNIDFKAAINELHGVRQAADLATTAVTKIPASLSTAAIDSLRSAVLGLKNDLSIGFKPVITIPKINIPPITVDVDTSASIAILDQLNQKIKSIEGLISIETDDIKLNELKNDLIKLQTEAHNIEVTIAPIEKTIIPVLDIRADDTDARNKLAALSGLVADTEKQILITTDTTELKLLQDRLAALHVQANEIQVTVEPIDIPKIDVPPIQIPTVSTGSFDNVLKVIDELHAKAVEPLGLKADDATVRKTVADLQALLKATTQTISITTDDEQVKLLESKVVALKTRIENLQILVGIEIPPIDLPKITVPKIEVDADASLANQVIIQLQTLASSIKADIDITSDPADVRRLEDNLNAIQTRIRDVQIKVAPITVPNIQIPPIEIPNIQTTAFQGVFAAIDTIHQNALAAAIDVSKIPASLAAVDAAGIDSFRASVQALKKDIEAGFKSDITIVPPSAFAEVENIRTRIETLQNEINELSKTDGGVKINTAQGVEAVNRLEQELEELEQAIKKSTGTAPVKQLGDQLVKLRTQIGTLKTTGFENALKNVSSSSTKAATGLSKINNSSGSAGFALQNLGRVAQDLPFGFLGIANNLNPLLESFQRLSIEAKSSGGIMKALSGALSGPAGIGLALSVVSGAILIFQNGISGFNKKTKEATDKFKEFVESIRSSSEILSEATGSVHGQIIQVQALATAVLDVNKANSERKRGLEELQRINKKLFGDITLEADSLKLLTQRVNEYTDALITQAVIKGFQDEISKIAPELLKQLKAFPKVAIGFDKLKKGAEQFDVAASSAFAGARPVNFFKGVEKGTDVFKKTTKDVLGLVDTFNTLKKQIADTVTASLKLKDIEGNVKDPKKVDKLKKQLDALKETSKAITDTIDDLQKKFKEATKQVDADKFFGEITKELEKLVDVEQQIFDLDVKIILRDAKEQGLSKKQIDGLIGAAKKPLQEALDKRFEFKWGPLKIKPVFDDTIKLEDLDPPDVQSEIAKALGLDKKIPILAQFEINAKLFGLDFAQTEKEIAARLENFQKNVRSIIDTGVVDAFGGLGDSLGSTLAAVFSGEGIGEALTNAAQSFLSIIGSVLQEVGKQIIITSSLVVALQKALAKTFTNPGIALGVGIALVAAGAILKNVLKNKKMPQFAEGGIASGPQSGYLTMLHGKELIVPLNKALGNMGGGGNVLVEVVGKTRGEDIYWATQRVIQRKGRI